ncbi:MAG: DUF1257 domain-containing protein [Cyanobacteria bacterium J06607_13]
MSHLTAIKVQYQNADALEAALKGVFDQYKVGNKNEIAVERYNIGDGRKLNAYSRSDSLASERCEIIMRKEQVANMRWNDIGFRWNPDRQAYDLFADDHANSLPFPRRELAQRISSHYAAAVAEQQGFIVNRDDILKGRLTVTKPEQSAQHVYA